MRGRQTAFSKNLLFFGFRPQRANSANDGRDGPGQLQGLSSSRQRHATPPPARESLRFLLHFESHSNRSQRVRDAPRRASHTHNARGATLACVVYGTGNNRNPAPERDLTALACVGPAFLKVGQTLFYDKIKIGTLEMARNYLDSTATKSGEFKTRELFVGGHVKRLANDVVMQQTEALEKLEMQYGEDYVINSISIARLSGQSRRTLHSTRTDQREQVSCRSNWTAFG